jgi:hypothetical protein
MEILVLQRTSFHIHSFIIPSVLLSFSLLSASADEYAEAGQLDLVKIDKQNAVTASIS